MGTRTSDSSLEGLGLRLALPDAVRGISSGSISIHLNPRELADLYQLASGAYAPLEGFLGPGDYQSVLDHQRLSDGAVWPIPITLSVTELTAQQLVRGTWVILTDRSHHPHGRLFLEHKYRPDREQEARRVFGTADMRHPGVFDVSKNGPVYLSGPVEIFHTSSLVDGLEWLPARIRMTFKQRGWRRIVAFQTRNPIHRAHEYIQKSAMESMDGLFVHPLIGPTKADDIPAEVRIKTYHAILQQWYPKKRVYLGAYTGPMRYAGPREAILHALIRRNYGATHFIVGRNHAGVGSFYGPYDAHRAFEEFTTRELGIQPLFFEDAFYCHQCNTMASTKTCPHDAQSHISLSGTEVRALLQSRRPIPPEFSRPEVAAILETYYNERNKAPKHEHPQ